MTGHPFPGLDEHGLRRVMLVCFAVFLAAGVGMAVLESTLTDRGAGIIELELAGADRSAAIVEEWSSQGCDDLGFDCEVGDVVWRAKAIILVDFAFLTAYGIGGAAILASLANRRRDRSAWVSRTLGLLSWAMLVAMVCDGAENTALWQVVVLNPQGFAEAATAFAALKFALVGIALIGAPVIVMASRSPRHNVEVVPCPETSVVSTPSQDRLSQGAATKP